jgi:hypothetical protein
MLGFIFISVAVFAWQGPTANPPNNNVPAPLNVSGNAQAKVGGLILNTGGAANGLIVDKGNVGIGILTPSKKLDVFTTGIKDDSVRIRRSDSTISTGLSINMGNQYPWIDYVGGIDFIPTTYNDLGTWIPNKTVALNINANGNIGIGTRDPLSKLYIKSTDPNYDYNMLTIEDSAGKKANLRIWGTSTGKYLEIEGPETAQAGTPKTVSIKDNLYTTNLYTTGNVGVGIANPSQKLEVNGNLRVIGNILKTGTVSFVENHPFDPNKQIVYVSLEGGEAGTYVRGEAKLSNGEAEITLPEHFALVTEKEGVTAQLTCIDECKGLRVIEVSNSILKVKELNNGQSNVRFYYLVNGVRNGYKNFNPIQNKK